MFNPLKLFGVVKFNVTAAAYHTSNSLHARLHVFTPTKFVNYNKKVFAPQKPDEERRPAYICHQKTNIRYSPDKMWYVAILVRGLSVDEAIKQLSFVLKKGASAVKQTILEAQELAVKTQNVEYKTNLWVAESFVGKGYVVKGFRRHAKRRFGIIEYKYCHYFVRLEEGTPPADYYGRKELSGPEMLDKWLGNWRKRKIIGSL